MSGDFFKSFSPKGKAQIRRILIKEYQKYIIHCIKTREEALTFELWLKKFGKKKGGGRCFVQNAEEK